ncbi:histone-lysine N-methyltransferase ASH1L-like [Thalassophryne amazonica]|uniref:histone-lysine N-methyltransferase ASH1L-like n=1 Tax=Thalassophryne amazonica TaxID=390379 RepID=UPI00147226C4|nr:histone-lysine N-methyltransferase ASH1L-like [Thalassophryne amazonica]XP_034030619.1 histone-lysine N-methyltransferase ASH1L-like [Thalassophryne amazonica]
MDQRVKGGTPLTTVSPLHPASPPENSEQEQVAENRKRGERENGDLGKKEEEKRGAGRKREGDKGAVLELHIEGRCGSTGQQQLQLSSRETSCPEGNVRLRIGVQTKRTKKPPKILESYVCKPTIRTYQRQGRGGLLKGDGDGGGGQKCKTRCTTDEAKREQRSGPDPLQTPSKHASSAASPPPVSSISSSTSLSPSLPASTPASAPALTSQGTKSTKQVPNKAADKTEVNSSGSQDRPKKEKHPSVNGQPVPVGQKGCSPSTEKTVSPNPSTPCPQSVSAADSRSDGHSAKKHNGLVQTAKQKGLSNGKGSSDIHGSAHSSKIKVGKLSSSSPATSKDSSTKQPVPSSSHKEHNLSRKSRPDSPSTPTADPESQLSPTVDPTSAPSSEQDPSSWVTLEKKREKEKKAKKGKRKDKKTKRSRLEVEKEKGEIRKDEGKKKKKEKAKEGKSRYGKEKNERHIHDNTWVSEIKTERGKAEKKPKDKLSPDGNRVEEISSKCGETGNSGKPDKNCKVVCPSRPGDKDKTDDVCRPVKQSEPTTTGDTSKSKEHDISRHSAVPLNPASNDPSSLPIASARPVVSSPSSPHEQDSRPLKKRKARRSSWTKLAHRAQRVESQDGPSGSQNNPSLNFLQNPKSSLPAKDAIQQPDESHPAPSRSLTISSSPLSSATNVNFETSVPALKCPVIPTRKRGRPKSHASSLDESPPRLSPNTVLPEVSPLGCDAVHNTPVLEPSPVHQCFTESKSSPKKRGRPPKRPFPEDQGGDALSQSGNKARSKTLDPLERGNRQLKIRRLINEMKKRKKRRLHKIMLSECGRKEGKGEPSLGACKSIEGTTVRTLSALSSSFGGKLGPQINVSKRGTIYMGKRRGRKPKAKTANLNAISLNSNQPSLFTSPTETSLFSSSHPQRPAHSFPSPSLTHSSGAQSPYSEASLTEPTSCLLFPHPFSLPSPSSSCTSPRPPSSSSLSSFVKKSCPCQGRRHFPFHQSSCKLSCPTPPLHHTAGSPGHLKEATTSPRSESHSEETLPSDSGIGTDNNSISERGEMRGARGLLRLGQGSGVILGSQRHPSSLVDCPSPVASPLSNMPRHTNSISSSANVERHREHHRHRRRDYDCSTSCSCLCPCPCVGHSKCTHSDFYPCLGHNALKRQKNKHKKKHQQLHMQDPEFLSELDDLIGQFSEVHIGRQSWARMGLEASFDGSGNAAGGRRHHSSSHSLRSNIFRINLNGFYSPHPSSYAPNSSFSAQPFYSCQPVHCNRKPDRRQCGCPSKFQETIDSMGFYSSYAPTTAIYHHLPSSYTLSSANQYASHQPHHAHFLLNPARFHRRRNRVLREGALGGEVEGDIGGSSGGASHLSSGFTSSLLPFGCGRSDHKRKHRHRHCDMDEEEELCEDDDEECIEREGMVSSKGRSGFVVGQGEGGRKGTRGIGSMVSKESSWFYENGSDSFSSTAAAGNTSSSSSSSSAERFKHTPLTSLGLGSSHLSSFGGGWGGLGQTWMKFGSLGGQGFGKSNPNWRVGSGEQQKSRIVASDDEDEDVEDVQQTDLYRTSPSPTHTNLFTSAATATSGKSLRSGLSSRCTGGGDRLWRTDEPFWTERREAGLQGDSQSREQPKSVPTSDSAAVKNKRRPGRPRKHPLLSTVSSPSCSSIALSISSPEIVPGHGREEGGRKEERRAERERGGGGGDTVQEVIESELQARRKKGRKRKHGDSPCRQSFDEDKSECDVPVACFRQSDGDEVQSQTVPDQREERDDGPPRKTFLRAGLYSDDYKITDPPSQVHQHCRDSLDYTPEEHEYNLLPAPIHVGKYLRLKRIHFQLPYDVMWLWQHNQLHRQPAVPLKRKRRYCRLKQKTMTSHHAAEETSSDITSLFPHLDMAPLTSSERSFVVKHHVFLVRNWELVRDRQIRLRVERERERDADGGEERSAPHFSRNGAHGDDSHIKSDQPVGVEVMDVSSDPHYQSQDTSSPLTASPCPTKTQNRPEKVREEEKRGEEEVCSREQRRKRLNDLLLTLQHS